MSPQQTFKKNSSPLKIAALTFLLSCLLIFNAFSQQSSFTIQQKLDMAMNFASENKAALQKVIDHYSKSRKDSLKLKATYFLIANMTGHFSYTGYQKNGVDSLIRYVVKATKASNGNFWQPGTFIQLDRLWFSVMADAAAKRSGPEYTYDNKAISADLLIENIEYAFITAAILLSSIT